MTKALFCKNAGEWNTVLELREVTLPAKPAAGLARVQMLAAAVHPSDFGMIAGTYGKAKTFPCVMGREGVGVIQEIGNGQETGNEKREMGLKVGDLVRIPETLGAWQQTLDCPLADLFPCPSDLPPEQLALSFINPPTALRLLEDFARLQPGDAVITNAGKSAVSQAFIQLARQRGLLPYAVVRGKTSEDDAWLKSLGAEAVFDEAEEYFKELHVKLALNQVGGESVLRLVKSLADHGVCVTIGGATKEPLRYPTRELIFKDAQLRGFWMDRWLREHSVAEVRAMMEMIWGLMRAGKLKQEIAGVFKLEDYRAALALAQEGKRKGKVVMRGD